MKTLNQPRLFPLSLTLLGALALAGTAGAGGGQSAPAAQLAAPPAQAQLQQPQSACGNQALCTDTPDFTATVTDFRLTQVNGMKVIDVVIRFQNKINDVLILGYVNGSEMALDDQGNRYVPNPWGNAFSGIGIVNGNQMDPKFSMRAGSWGDARFELVWRPGPQDPIGSTFELAMSIREITTLAGGQHALAGEFPLDIKGLANGVAGVSPAYARSAPGASSVLASGGTAAAAYPAVANTGTAAALPPCGPAGAPAGTNAAAAANTAAAVAGATNSAGAQNTAATANSTMSNAAAAISSLGSIFGKKKAAPATPTANAAAATTPCIPAAAGATASVAASPAANAAVQQAAQQAGAAKAAAAGTAPVAAAAAAAATTKTAAGTAAKAATTTAKTTAQTAKIPAKKPTTTPPPPPADKTTMQPPQN